MTHPLIKEIFAPRTVTDKNGKTYALHSGIEPVEGEFTAGLIRENPVVNSLEIGLAFGISALYIRDALSQKPSPRHTIIDPFEFKHWHGVGVYNLERAGFAFYKLMEKPSELALPELVEKGERFDFALIDGRHRFHHALLDFFYIDQLLEVGGIVVFDDAAKPAVNKVLRYLVNYPNYKFIGSVGSRSAEHQPPSHLKKLLQSTIPHLPNAPFSEIFDPSVFKSDEALGISGTMVALRKLALDERKGYWFTPFWRGSSDEQNILLRRHRGPVFSCGLQFHWNERGRSSGHPRTSDAHQSCGYDQRRQ